MPPPLTGCAPFNPIFIAAASFKSLQPSISISSTSRVAFYRPANAAPSVPILHPILRRIGANPHAWPDTISRFGSKFRLAAGLLSSLRSFADQLGRRWLSGVTAARSSFAPSLPHSA